MGNTVSNIVLVCMVADGDSTYCGDQFTAYTNVESLCWIHETNIILHVNYTSIKKKERAHWILYKELLPGIYVMFS